MYDIAIIGAGVIGTFIARELSRYKIKIIIIERENDVANGSTMANSGIVYDGYHSNPDRMKGKLIPKGNLLFDKFCEELDVPFKRVGSLVVGFNDKDYEKIEKLYKKGLKNRVPDMRIINRDEILKIDPNINADVKFALYSPTCGIVSPFEMTVALAENAMDNGAILLLNNEVIDIKSIGRNFKITTTKQEIEANCVINCAGIYADKINNMIAPPSFKIIPKRGQYLVLDKNAGNLVNSVIQQCKVEDEKGILFIPTVHNNLMLGPGLDSAENKEAMETTEDMMESIKKKAVKVCEDVPFNQVIRSFSGLKAKIDTEDFVVEESSDIKGFINVAGIATPGLTCSPAIAEIVVKLVKNIFDRNDKNIVHKEDFNPRRRNVIRFNDLNEGEKSELIKKDTAYGRVICRCQTITEGEIIDAIHRNAGATTVKGVKKRTTTSMGRCQGGFCGPKIVEILSRELGKKMNEILYDDAGSYILTDRK